ncbi:uncharacterized protein TNCV_42331 [Trichonephila clavipes]|nr:uncharacterized protein TNCV_42331 [Trichonephila clavipes]
MTLTSNERATETVLFAGWCAYAKIFPFLADQRASRKMGISKQKEFCALLFAKIESAVTEQRAFRIKFGCQSPNDNILRYHQFETTVCLCKGKRDLIRVVEDLDGTVESTDTIAKLKIKIEKSSTFESDADFVKTLIKNCIDERVSRNEREATLEKQKIELAKLQLAQLEKEVELQTAKNKALSLSPAAKVEEKQFETNIENMIKSIKSLSLPVPTRSENFNMFFQSLERAFLTKKINDEYKSEILIIFSSGRKSSKCLIVY